MEVTGLILRHTLVTLSGSVAFELGPTKDVTLKDKTVKKVSTMTIGGADISAGTYAFLLSSLAAPARAATKVPGARGPLPVTGDAHPFGAADHTRVPTDLWICQTDSDR